MWVTAVVAKQFEIGLGDEVFITGLFKHYTGTKQNIPILRIGNLVCDETERVVTKDYGEIAAQLIEVRSLGGLSGSPVFFNLGRIRAVGSDLKIVRNPPPFLMGLVHGHFEAPLKSTATAVGTDAASFVDAENLNVGIAVVVPVKSIFDVVLEFLKSKGQADLFSKT